jgi:hypothetical protein
VAEVVVEEEEGTTSLQLAEEALSAQVDAVLRRVRADRRYNAWAEGAGEVLGPALDAASAGLSVTEAPLDPYDLLRVIVAQLIKVAGAARPPAAPCRTPRLSSRACSARFTPSQAHRGLPATAVPASSAGVSAPRPNLFGRVGQLIGGVFGAPKAALRQVRCPATRLCTAPRQP